MKKLLFVTIKNTRRGYFSMKKRVCLLKRS